MTAREDLRRRRVEVMLEAGSLLRTWRETHRIQQQDLAALACVSPTVVRRIEKGDYESPPPQSLLAALGRQQGPVRELKELARDYERLQGEQKRIDKLLTRKTLPDTVELFTSADGRTVLAGLKPAALPRAPSLFVGRHREMDALDQLLDHHRLVTVVGPGGIGKTALCLRFAATRSAAPSGPWFADLSQLRPGEPVLPLLARLILDEDGGGGDVGDPDEVTARFGAVFGRMPALLIFDNCEHVLTEAAEAVSRLLDVCPGIRVMATSREPMHLPDESVMTVGPLPVTGGKTLEDGLSAAPPGDAVELFTRLLARARGEQAAPRTPDAAVVTLCRQLDGIPLCLELAAARARTMPLNDIAESMGRGLAILSGGRRDLPRHQAITATIGWSWDLLPGDEQRALSRLAVLTVPFTFRCGAEIASEDLHAGESIVAALADKSLLSQEAADPDEGRFRILSVVRNFAVARLSAADRQDAIRNLMSWALRMTQIDEVAVQQPDVVERLDAAFPLIREALELSEDAPADQVRLALAIWQYWHVRSSSSYGGKFLAKAYDENVALSPRERGRALGALANLRGYQGDMAGSIEASKKSIEIRREIGDPTQLRYGLINLLGTSLQARRLLDAERCLSEIDEIPGEIEPSAQADLNVMRATFYVHHGDTRQAMQLLEDACELYAREKLELGLGACLQIMSLAHRVAGDFEASLQAAVKARELIGQAFGPAFEGELTVIAAAAYQALGKQEDVLIVLDGAPADEHVRPSTRAHALALRAMAASAAAPSAAATFLIPHVKLFASHAEGVNLAIYLVMAVQEIAYQSGEYQRAARLLGLHDRLSRETGEVDPGPPFPDSWSRLKNHLGEPELPELIADGAKVEPDQAVDLAAGILSDLAAREALG